MFFVYIVSRVWCGLDKGEFFYFRIVGLKFYFLILKIWVRNDFLFLMN